MKRKTSLVTVLLVIAFLRFARAADFTPDSASVQREGPAYRYPQAGWIVLHIEGEPYERGYQHGKLMANEIADYVKCYATMQSPTSPSEGWKITRTMVDSLFARKFDPEYLEEMKGIADGAVAGGAKFDGRALDLTDIIAINVWSEVMCLDGANQATPNGLEGKTFGKPVGAKTPVAVKPSRCSAFVATGPATKDGKVVIGHITMFDLYPCNFFNVWLDVKPAKGHRVIIQTSPGGIQSGLDYYQNDAGMVMVETTIGQTKFNAEGMSVGSRSRKAMQYGDSIDQIVDIFTQGNNGLYTNEWLIADTKTDEIACFELGTNKTKLYRSSKNEWFGGTEGFYWGCNNTKDLQVRLETIPATNDRPADMTFVPEPRDMMWVKLYREHKGNIDADFGKLAFTTPPLAAHSSCDAKVTTTDLTREMKSWALWGAPLGKSWQPTQDQREKYPDIKPLAGNPWTILTINPPASGKDEIAAVDLTKDDADDSDDSKDDDDKRQPEPAWHGTILASADADVWLASGFARFHEYAARSNQLANENKEDDKPLSEKQCDELAGKLFRARSDALIAARTGGAVPLSKIRSDVTDDNWARQATGRGVMLLCELRRKLGDEKFDAMMDAFGRENAGKPVTTASFIACAEMSAGTSLSDFFSPWIDGTALPTLKMVSVDSKKRDGSSSDKESWVVTGEVAFEGSPAPASVDVTLENEDDETTQTIAFEGGKASFKFDTEKKPMRVVANKYGFTPASNGWVFSTTSFMRDLDHTLIVYGTQDESSANREAAEEMQKAIRDSWKNYTVPIKSDIEVSDEDLRTHHLLLIGRPDCNSVTMKMREVLPVKFGWRSFIIRGETYANMNSAIISAGENPLNPALSVVCCAGLSAGATLHAAPMIAGWQGTPVKIVPAYGKSTDIVPEAPELAHSLSQ